MLMVGRDTRDPAAMPFAGNRLECSILARTTRVGSRYLISSSGGLNLENIQHNHNKHQSQYQPHHHLNLPHKRQTPRYDHHSLAHHRHDHHHHHHHHHPLDHKHHLVPLVCLLLLLAALDRLRRLRRRERDTDLYAAAESRACAIGHLLLMAGRLFVRYFPRFCFNGVDEEKSLKPTHDVAVGQPRRVATHNGQDRAKTETANKGQADWATTTTTAISERRDFQRDKQVEIAIIYGHARQRRRSACSNRTRLARNSDAHVLRPMAALVAVALCLCFLCCLADSTTTTSDARPGGDQVQPAHQGENTTATVPSEFLQPRIEEVDESTINSTIVGQRRNFGQRLLAFGGQRVANSLIARTLRHLNGTSLAGLAASSGTAATGHNSTARVRDYETTQISSDTPTSNRSTLARPNLTLDTWAKLINLRNMNSAHHHHALWLPASIVGAQLGHDRHAARANTSDVTPPSSELNWNFTNSSTLMATTKMPGDDQLTPGSLRRAATSGARVLSIPHPHAGGAQESFSIGIVIKPHQMMTMNETTLGRPTGRPGGIGAGAGQQVVEYQLDSPSSVSAPTASAVVNSNSSFGSPDWQASSEIEHVIRVDDADQDSSSSRAGSKESSEMRAHRVKGKGGAREEGETLKGNEEKGQWSRERAGEERKEGAEKKAGKQGDKRLVDLGHNKHGWKNVYHKEEYAQHQKYHDIYRDKDWHDKREKAGEQRAWQDGSKFKENLAADYLDKHKHGSKYDYRKGNEWKRSEESDGRDETTTAVADEAAGEQRQSEAPKPQQQHVMSGSSARNSVEPSQDQDGDQSDDLILEQMKARLESMSELHGGGGHEDGDRSRIASGSGQYELKSPPPTNGSIGDEPDGGARRRESRGEEGRGPNHLLSGQQTRGLEFVRPALNNHENGNDATDDDDDDDDGRRHHHFGKHLNYQHNTGDNVGLPQTTQAPALARTEDKRNELRLKLELDLGKSTATNQGGGGGGTGRAASGSVKQSTDNGSERNFTATPTHTNSLGHAIGRHPQQQQQYQKSRDQYEAPKQQQQAPPRKQFENLDNSAKHNNNNNNGLGANKQWANNGNYIGNKDHSKSSLLTSGKVNKWPKQSGYQFDNNNNNKSYFESHPFSGGGRHSNGPPPPELHSIVSTHSFSPMLSEDLTVENSLGGLVEDHELTLAGARPDFNSMPPEQFNAKGAPASTSHKEYMLMFGLGHDDTGHDHHVAAGSDHHHHRQAASSSERANPPPGLDYHPNVVFEASASDLYDDFHGPAAATGVDYYHSDSTQSNPPPERIGGDRHPRPTMSEYLSSDFSAPRLNFASPANYNEAASSSAGDDDDESDMFTDSEVEGNGKFNHQENIQGGGAANSQAPVSASEALLSQQILQLLNSDNQQQQQQSRPVIASLRDHMNLLPIGNLLRAASSINQVSNQLMPLSSFSNGATGGQRSLMAPFAHAHHYNQQSQMQQQQQHALSSAASVPFGRWLRLPRVIESQIQQQRLRRQRQLAEQQVALAAAATSTGSGPAWQALATNKRHIGNGGLGASQGSANALSISKPPTDLNKLPATTPSGSGRGPFIDHQVAFEKLYPGGPVDYNRLLESVSRLNFAIDPMQAEPTSPRATHATKEARPHTSTKQLATHSKSKQSRKANHSSNLSANQSRGAAHHAQNMTRLYAPTSKRKFHQPTHSGGRHSQTGRHHGSRSTPSTLFAGSSSTRLGLNDRATIEAAASMQQARYAALPSSSQIMNHQQERSSPPASRLVITAVSGDHFRAVNLPPRALVAGGDHHWAPPTPSSSSQTEAWSRQLPFQPTNTTLKPHRALASGANLKPYLMSATNYKSHKDATATSMQLRDFNKQQQQAVMVNNQQQQAATSGMKTTISSLGERLLDNLKISKLIPTAGG